MEFNWLLVLAAVWFFLNLINNARQKPQQPPRTGPQEPLRPRSLPPTPDATQREGHRLELVLRELQRSLEGAAGVERPIPTTTSLPSDEEVEERTSLEEEPEIRSLEAEVKREVRRRVDRDEETADIEAQRIQAAAARDSARTKADHTAFDERIRQEPADHTATRSYTPQQLRDAMVWREVLGPPVSLREEER